MVDQEHEGSHDRQQEKLNPQRHAAAAHHFGLTRRGSRRQKPGGGGGGGERGGEGGGGVGRGQAGDSVDCVALCVGGAAGPGGFWREEAVFVVPQVAGFYWATGGSSDWSPTGGAADRRGF